MGLGTRVGIIIVTVTITTGITRSVIVVEGANR